MNDHVSLALNYLWERVPEESRCYIRFISYYDLADSPDRDSIIRLSNWWWNQMSFDDTYHLPRAISGSKGLLYALDLRDYRWNTAAWASVARRDVRFRQPWLYFRSAEQLRREQGYYSFDEADLDANGTLPVLGMVSGTWLLRETLESNRSPSYYDLLFAERRFTYKDGKPALTRVSLRTRVPEDWPGGVDPRDGRHYEPGRYLASKTVTREVPDWKAVTFKDFPATNTELEEALGVDAVKAFGKANRFDLDNGAIVAGGRDDRQNGSIVALNNRIVSVLDGPLGPYLQTFDVEKTAGLKDYSEALVFGGRRFRRGQGVVAEFDGGEILFYLPNGGQAGLLINGQGKRVEFATSTLANDTADKSLNIGVRTYGSCITCHAGGGGFIRPRSLDKIWKEQGIEHRFADPEQRNRFVGFFRGLDRRMDSATRKYGELITDTTSPSVGGVGQQGANQPAWTGADIASQVLTFRSSYDDMVTPQVAARELGIPLPALTWLALRAGVEPANEKGRVVRRNTRAQELSRGLAVPRSAWDENVLPQMGLLLDAYQTSPDFKRLFDTVQIQGSK